jgi:ABC-type dipeptide/oligopeptide/nickel transport system ATPase component
MSPILSVRNLKVLLTIDGKAHDLVCGLSFDLIKGKTLAIVGESGSGKTVTAHSLLQILPNPPFLPPRGEVLFRGKNLLTMRKNALRKIRGSKIAMIFQNPSSALNPVYTIGFQLMEVMKTHLKMEGKEAEEKILSTLKDVSLPRPNELLKEYPHQLSGGMLQRVMIAMALLTGPDILIADEPTTALDVTIQKQILELLKQIQKKRNMALLIITHDFGVVAEIADTVLVMSAGKIVESGDVNTIFDNPSHPYTKSLLNFHLAREKK